MATPANPAAAPPVQSPALNAAPNPVQAGLAKITMLLQGLMQQNPVLQSGLTKAIQGISEAQSAMASQTAPQPAAANPPV